MDGAEANRLCDDGLLSIEEAMEFLQISRSHLYKFMKSGALKSVKLGKSRRVPHKAAVEFAASLMEG